MRKEFLDHEYGWKHYRQREQNLRQPRGRSVLLKRTQASQCGWISEDERAVPWSWSYHTGSYRPMRGVWTDPKTMESHWKALSRIFVSSKDHSGWRKWIAEQERKWGSGGEVEADIWVVVVASWRLEVIQGGGLGCSFGGRTVSSGWLFKCEGIRKGIEDS